MSELILNTSEEAAEVQTAEEPQQETRSEQQKQERPEVEGILEIVEENDFGFLRFNNFLTSEKDIYVSPTQIRRFRLKTGDKIRGITRLPNPGEKFPDYAAFAQYGRGYSDIADWRRDNVNVLIKEIHETVRECKPWVKFGVSPFGIYRNKKSDPNGSETNGLQNYDDLYADVLMWVNNGWVDYNIPQIYWEIGHKAADYETLIHWWAKHASARPLFIGQDVLRTVKNVDLQNPSQHQLPAKMKLQRSLPSVSGSCQWYAAAVVDNPGNYCSLLEKTYHRYPALIPASPFMDDKAPGKVKKVKMVWTFQGPVLFWSAPSAKDEMDKAIQYVVYRFGAKEKIDLNDPSHIVAITRDTFVNLPYEDGKVKYQYVVTALDRLHNESKPVKKKVKL